MFAQYPSGVGIVFLVVGIVPSSNRGFAHAALSVHQQEHIFSFKEFLPNGFQIVLSPEEYFGAEGRSSEGARDFFIAVYFIADMYLMSRNGTINDCVFGIFHGSTKIGFLNFINIVNFLGMLDKRRRMLVFFHFRLHLRVGLRLLLHLPQQRQNALANLILSDSRCLKIHDTEADLFQHLVVAS